MLRFNILFSIVLAVMQPRVVSAQQLNPVSSFGSNPGNLKMYLYTPSGIKPNESKPLVVVLHGCLQNAKVVAKQTGWNKLADKYGFRVLYPQQRILNNPAKCFCWYNRKDIEKGEGENFSIKEMIEEVRKNYQVQTDSIFITGLSAGAAMAVTMMADYPDLFNAGAVFAGGAYKTATNIFTATMAMYGWRIKSPENWAKLVRAQNPSYKGSYPRMIIYHGNADVVVNKRNGSQIMKQWTYLHGIGTVPTETINRFAGTKAVQKNIYRNRDSVAVVTYYKIKRMGHALPIDPGQCENQGGKRLPFSADKNFYSTYWTAVDFGLIPLAEIQGKKTVSPHEDVSYAVPLQTNTQFEWTYPKDCTLLGDKNTNTIHLKWGSHAGNVQVRAWTSEKCSTIFPTLFVNVKE